MILIHPHNFVFGVLKTVQVSWLLFAVALNFIFVHFRKTDLVPAPMSSCQSLVKRAVVGWQSPPLTPPPLYLVQHMAHSYSRYVVHSVHHSRHRTAVSYHSSISLSPLQIHNKTTLYLYGMCDIFSLSILQSYNWTQPHINNDNIKMLLT